MIISADAMHQPAIVSPNPTQPNPTNWLEEPLIVSWKGGNRVRCVHLYSSSGRQVAGSGGGTGESGRFSAGASPSRQQTTSGLPQTCPSP